MDARQIITQRHLCRPINRSDSLCTYPLAQLPIWLREITSKSTGKTDYIGNQLREFWDRQTIARTDINVTGAWVNLHQICAGFGAVIDVQEFAPRSVRGPLWC